MTFSCSRPALVSGLLAQWRSYAIYSFPMLGQVNLSLGVREQQKITTTPAFADLFLEAGKTAFLGIHGLGGAPKELEYLGKRLYRSGITVSAPLLPGHESASALKKARWPLWAGFLEERLDALFERHGPVFVGGLCSGAWLALALAAKKPHQVAGLVLYSTTYYYDGWNNGRLGAAWVWLALYTPIRWFYSFPTERPPYGIKDARLQRLIAAHARHADGTDAMKAGFSAIPAPCFGQMHGLRAWVRPHLAAIHHPALLLHSREDDLTSIKSSEYVLHRLGSQDKRLIALDDCYHLITLDKQKHLVAQATTDFIVQHSLGSKKGPCPDDLCPGARSAAL